ncbi:DNA primase [Alcanivorax sp. 1008]|uniref:DNA primase n=1 Tax=Alcanivorax sp. 1008 TaxID=2816853 RepID=UPI001D8CE171|nr:DNA primase [Alcanivorax sp. 1008]MCC1496799.1 DNA primase [Alcanivorax sp. 1008]
MEAPRHLIDKVKQLASIKAVVGDRVSMPNRSGNVMVCCPFHDDGSPSMVVNVKKNNAFCFSCRKGGDPIEFIQRFDGVSFREALESAGDYAGIDVRAELKQQQPVDSAEAAEAKKFYAAQRKAIDEAHEAFRQALKSDESAYSYLRTTRGVSDEAIEKFGLGLAPDDFGFLSRARFKAGWIQEAAISIGLCKSSERAGNVYDHFRGRIMFPFETKPGSVTGFTGRAIADVKPKYLNSPESEVFQKAELVYGLNQAKDHKENGPFLALEGQFDVIRCWMAGFPAGALSGSSVSDVQLSRIFREFDEICFVFDGDVAGAKASLRTMERIAAEVGGSKHVSFAFLPDGYDPDDFIKEHGADVFAERIAHRLTFGQCLSRLIVGSSKLTAGSPESRQKLVAELREWMDRIVDPGLRLGLIESVANAAGIPHEALLDALSHEGNDVADEAATESELPDCRVDPEPHQEMESLIRQQPAFTLLYLSAKHESVRQHILNRQDVACAGGARKVLLQAIAGEDRVIDDELRKEVSRFSKAAEHLMPFGIMLEDDIDACIRLADRACDAILPDLASAAPASPVPASTSINAASDPFALPSVSSSQNTKHHDQVVSPDVDVKKKPEPVDSDSVAALYSPPSF